jgi:hypothetical protein
MGQRIGPIFKGQEVQEEKKAHKKICNLYEQQENMQFIQTVYFLASFLLFLDFLPLEDGTNAMSRTIGKGLPFDAA